MKLFTILFIIFNSFCVFGQQYFEGSIQYSHDLRPRSKTIDIVKLRKLVGNGSTLYFKDGNFRHDHDGGEFEFNLYNRVENRSYYKKRDNDTIFWSDCSKGGSCIVRIKPAAKQMEILGIKCRELYIEYTDHVKVEYFNSDSIRVDPGWFTQYKRDDQYKVDAIERSIFLRSELKYPMVQLITQATAVRRKVLSDDIFKIPADAILVEKK